MSTTETIGLWVGVGFVCAVLTAILIFWPRIRSAWLRRSGRSSFHKLPE
jgi:high-affinity Fe2+/Pb2+ permease